MQERPSRASDAAKRHELAEAHARADSEAAQRLIDDFLVKVRAAGIQPVGLRAKLLSGAEVKTDKSGWYLRKNHSLAIGVDGGYYQLTVSGTALDRIRGIRLAASPPPLVVGRGGRDGESGDLADFLARILSRET